jgi:glycosyltransferase involved in cell wall biosynthesis
MMLSVVIPVYNEATTVERLVAAVRAVPLDKQIVIVDDGSSDGTGERLEHIAGSGGVTVLRHDRNRGKGAAIRSALTAVTGDLVVIQDADLEYDPGEYPRLIAPILEGRADVVYGSRFAGDQARRPRRSWHFMGNQALTRLSNVFTRLDLTDMETCHKVFRREVLESMELREDRFGFEPEVTAKVARGGWRIEEIGIGYDGRSYAEGKKIGWTDGVAAIWCIVKYNLLDRGRGGRGPGRR